MKKKILIPVIIVLTAAIFASCGKQSDQEVIATELETTEEETTGVVEATVEATIESVETTAEETEAETEESEDTEVEELEEETETTEAEAGTETDTQDTKSASSEGTSKTSSSHSANNNGTSNSGSVGSGSKTGSAEKGSDTTAAPQETPQTAPATSSETTTPPTSTNPETAPNETVQNPFGTFPDGSASVGAAENTPATSAPIPDPEPVQSPTPAHEHTWKEHTATTQTWIPNIVVVDDYETQTTSYNSYHCACGFETTDTETMRTHSRDHAFAGESYNFGIIPITEEQQVLVGSHEEDQGHYESSTYVDYYYCDCGATK